MQAHAGEAAVRTTPAPQPMAAFSQQDINGLFDQADKPMQLAALSKQEMTNTEGAWGPAGAIIGGLGALGGYTINKIIAGERWSLTTAATLTGLGAAAGAFAGPNGVVWGVNSALTAGMVEGISSRTGW